MLKEYSLSGGFIKSGAGQILDIYGAALSYTPNTSLGESNEHFGKSAVHLDDGTGRYTVFKTGNPSTRSFTCMARVNLLAQPVSPGVVARSGSSGTGTFIPLWRNSGTFDMRVGGTDYTGAGTWNLGQWYDQDIVGAASSCILDVNGDRVITGSAATSSTIDDSLAIGDVAGGGVGSGDVKFGYILIASKPLSAERRRELRENVWRLFEPSRRLIFLPESAGGTSTVSADSSTQYSIINAVFADSESAFSVRNQVAADLASIFNTRASAQSDVEAAYSVRGAVDSDIDSSYTVRGTASIDGDASYNIQGAVASDLATAYAIESGTSVSASLATAYSIRGPVAADKAASYVVRGAVTEESGTAYSILGTVARDIGAAYTIEQATSVASSDLTTAYTINGIVPPAATPEEIAAAVRAELAVELGRLTKLANLSAIDAVLTVTPTSRMAGGVSQIIATAGDTTTVETL